MANERSGLSGGQVTVALIGAAAVLGSALIANSDRLFGPRADPERPPASLPGPTASPSTALVPPEAAPTQIAPPAQAAFSMAGAWRGDDGSVWEFSQDGDRFGAEQSEGVERVRIEGQVSGQSVRMWVDYFQASSGNLGLRIMTCEGQFMGAGQQLQLSCINPQTNVTTRPTWSRA
jgi:hypothetical protein